MFDDPTSHRAKQNPRAIGMADAFQPRATFEDSGRARASTDPAPALFIFVDELVRDHGAAPDLRVECQGLPRALRDCCEPARTSRASERTFALRGSVAARDCPRPVG